MSSRSYILNRVKVAVKATGVSREADCAAERRSLPRHYDCEGKLDEAERLKLFDERLRHYNGMPIYGTGDTCANIAGILTARQKRVLITPPAFPREWLPSGFMFIPDENLTKEQLDLSDGVITLCTLAIALTGTVVLQSSREQGRRAATLIPDYHLCVLRQADLVELVPEAISKLAPSRNMPLTFVSGPSATVDIEMTRVGGVHGPRVLDVLII